MTFDSLLVAVTWIAVKRVQNFSPMKFPKAFGYLKMTLSTYWQSKSYSLTWSYTYVVINFFL